MSRASLALRPVALEEWILGQALSRKGEDRRHESLRGQVDSLARQNEALRAEVQQLREIGDIVRSITSSLYIEEILTNILRGIRKTLGFNRVVLGLVNSEKGCEELKLAVDAGSSLLSSASWSIRDGVVWARLRQASAPIVVDPDQDDDVPEIVRDMFPAKFVKAPMIVKGEILGTIMCDRQDDVLDLADLDLLDMFSEFAAVAIQNGRLYYDVIKSEESLKKAHDKLVDAEKMALIGHMAVSINHEINNPLCNISLITQTVCDRLQPENADLTRLLNGIGENIDRIKSVTDKIAGMKSANLTEYLPNQLMVDLQ